MAASTALCDAVEASNVEMELAQHVITRAVGNQPRWVCLSHDFDRARRQAAKRSPPAVGFRMDEVALSAAVLFQRKSVQ